MYRHEAVIHFDFIPSYTQSGLLIVLDSVFK
jgi:hypothetical protein